MATNIKKNPKDIIKKLSNKNYLKKILLPILVKENPETLRITKIYTSVIKKYISSKYGHFVCFYSLTIKTKLNKEKKIKLIGIFRSDNQNEKHFKWLKYIAKNKFQETQFLFIKPFAFITDLNTLFYYFIKGKNLFSQFEKKEKNLDILYPFMELSGKWLANFHSIKPKKNLPKTVSWKYIDPVDILLRKEDLIITHKKNILSIYKKTQRYKKTFTTHKNDFVLTHGDFHLQNIIFYKKKDEYKIAVIDFSDLRIAPFTLDLAFFYMQLYFMGRQLLSKQEISKLQNKFLKSYLKERNISLSNNQKKQFNYFKAIISIRSAIFFISIKEKSAYFDAIKQINIKN